MSLTLLIRGVSYQAVWLLLSQGNKDDPTRAARVGSAVNRLVQAAEEDGRENNNSGDSDGRRLDKHVGLFRETVLGRGGWAVLPPLHMGVDPAGLAARDVWLVFAERLRTLLLETVCDGTGSTDIPFCVRLCEECAVL